MEIPASKQTQREEELQLPFKWTYSFKLLGLILNCNWGFRQHFWETRQKLQRRLHLLTKVSNKAWGLEGGILAATPHALLKSKLSYGLATTGAHISTQEIRRVDTTVLNRDARAIAGTNITMIAESPMMLSDIKSARNHNALKNADILDRMLRAKGAAAQTNNMDTLRRGGYTGGLWNPKETHFKWTVIRWGPKTMQVKAMKSSEELDKDRTEANTQEIWEISALRAA